MKKRQVCILHKHLQMDIYWDWTYQVYKLDLQGIKETQINN